MSEYTMRCTLRHDGIREWRMHSSWDIEPPTSRLRTLVGRTNWTTDEKKARAWAKKRGIDFVSEPEPPRRRT